MAINGTGLGRLIKYLDAYRQYGLQCHPTRPWAKKIRNSDYGKNLCCKIIVKQGDAFFVGGGCPHALGEGCFVIEVQEPSDITLPMSKWRPDV